MRVQMRRRRVLRRAAAVSSLALAGCSELQASSEDDGGGVARKPDPDDPPRNVLPAPSDGVAIVGLRTTGGSVGANAGQLATYEADDGATFDVAAIRMETESRAADLANRITEQGRFYRMSFAVRHGVYIIAGGLKHGSQERLLWLLSQSSALSRSFVKEHDLLGGGGSTEG